MNWFQVQKSRFQSGFVGFPRFHGVFRQNIDNPTPPHTWFHVHFLDLQFSGSVIHRASKVKDRVFLAGGLVLKSSKLDFDEPKILKVTRNCIYIVYRIVSFAGFLILDFLNFTPIRVQQKAISGCCEDRESMHIKQIRNDSGTRKAVMEITNYVDNLTLCSITYWRLEIRMFDVQSPIKNVLNVAHNHALLHRIHESVFMKG